MTSTSTTKLRSGAAAALVGAALIAAGCGSSNTTSSSTSSAAASSSAAAGGGYGASSSSAAAPAAGASVAAAHGKHGMYLTGASGRALYLWVADHGGKSSCSGGCATVWPPLLTRGAPSAGSGVTGSKLGTITRADGTKQVTYGGHPLYYYVSDTAAGMLSGEGSNSFGAKWWLVAPTGAAVTSGAAKGGSGASGASSSSSSSGGWG